MALHSTAQGLATLGRHGDSVLVHMQPQEVAGLQALAKSQGTSLTVNPNTGMPEAFNLGNFFTSLLPTLAGFMVGGPAGAAMGLESTAATLAPIAAGVATGAAVAGAKGEDVLSGALMGGLGGYGGGNLGSAFGKMGGAGVATPAISSGQGINLTANNLTAPAISNPNMIGQALDKSVNNLSSTLTNPLGTGTGGAGIKLAPMMNQGLSTDVLSNVGSMASNTGIPVASNALDLARPPSGFNSMLSGAGKFASDPIGQYDAFKAAGGSGYQIGAPLAMAGLSAMQPEPYDYAGDEAKRKAEENKYRDPITGKLNLSASSGLNLTGFAMGGQVDLNPSVGGGISDLYNRPEGATTQSISSDGYGMGRLDRLSQQGSLAKAGDMFYAQGGPVSFADGGDTGMNIDKLPSLNLNTGISSLGGTDGNNLAPNMLQNAPQLYMAAKLFGMNPATMSQSDLSNLVNTISNPKGSRGYAEGGETHMNLDRLPSLNVNTGKQGFVGGSKNVLSYILKMSPSEVAEGLRISPSKADAMFNLVNNGSLMPDRGGANNPFMAKGGYLNGAGDGMSDSIPATIEGKQPARLADGEFVVPADVVSHLGNGSSKAGSKRLYAMLDKVRHARTGNKKQGKEINPNKYMPA